MDFMNTPRAKLGGLSRAEALALVQTRYPCVRGSVVEDSRGKPQLHLENPPVRCNTGTRMGRSWDVVSLRDLVEVCQAKQSGDDIFHFPHDAAALTHVFGSDVDTQLGGDFVVALRRINVIVPDAQVAAAAGQWLHRVHQGTASTIYTVVCPDYAYDENRRYTFTGLNAGTGLVADRFLAGLPELEAWVDRNTLSSVRVVIAIADIEAYSEVNRQRMGVTLPQFLARLRRSQQAIAGALASVAPQLAGATQVCFVTDLLPEGYTTWEQLVTEAGPISRGDSPTGPIEVGVSDWSIIRAARTAFYQRWFGRTALSQSGEQILRSAGRDYIAMGLLLDRFLDNALALCADSDQMAVFWHGGATQARPVIHLQREAY